MFRRSGFDGGCRGIEAFSIPDEDIIILKLSLLRRGSSLEPVGVALER